MVQSAYTDISRDNRYFWNIEGLIQRVMSNIPICNMIIFRYVGICYCFLFAIGFMINYVVQLPVTHQPFLFCHEKETKIWTSKWMFKRIFISIFVFGMPNDKKRFWILKYVMIILTYFCFKILIMAIKTHKYIHTRNITRCNEKLLIIPRLQYPLELAGTSFIDI